MNNSYIKVYHEAPEMVGLPITAQHLYAYIRGFWDAGRHCFFCDAHLAGIIKRSKQTVQRLLKLLEDKGLIFRRCEKNKYTGNTTRYIESKPQPTPAQVEQVKRDNIASDKATAEAQATGVQPAQMGYAEIAKTIKFDDFVALVQGYDQHIVIPYKGVNYALRTAKNKNRLYNADTGEDATGSMTKHFYKRAYSAKNRELVLRKHPIEYCRGFV